MRNIEVVKAWTGGERAKAGNLHTDGVQLYSYGLCIGDTMLSGRKVVYDYTSGGALGWISQTTSCHVRLAKRLT